MFKETEDKSSVITKRCVAYFIFNDDENSSKSCL